MYEMNQPAINDAGADSSSLSTFGRSFVQSGIERPFNAVVEIANHAGADLPELHLVDSDDAGAKEHPVAFAAGQIAGVAFDVFLLSKLVNSRLDKYSLQGMGPIGRRTLATGIAGFIHGSVFQPSNDTDADNFIVGRLSNGLIEGGTWTAMAAMSQGLFHAPMGMKSLSKEVFRGGLAGLTGGYTHAFLTAGLKEGRLPTESEVNGDALPYMALGAVFGGLNYAQVAIADKIGSLRNPAPRSFQSGFEKVRVTLDHQGKPIGVNVQDFPYSDFYAKKVDGSWVPTDSRLPRIAKLSQAPNGTIAILDEPVQVGTTGSFAHRIMALEPRGRNMRVTVHGPSSVFGNLNAEQTVFTDSPSPTSTVNVFSPSRPRQLYDYRLSEFRNVLTEPKSYTQMTAAQIINWVQGILKTAPAK